MLIVNKITSNPTVDFAAEELKKYLRMMNPNGGDVTIRYDPAATDGFRLGLMQDFALDVSDVKDVALDDLLYIDVTAEGGIVAGNNPRSVLLAVYELLRRQGCRWLFPGVDGEFIPIKESLSPVKARIVPSCRYRGHCIEGAPSQQAVLDIIDFLPKVGMNVYMSQFLTPALWMRLYYDHRFQTKRKPEQISEAQILQWKMQSEAELSKRGIQFHDVGHGWTAAPFGIDINAVWDDAMSASLSEDTTRYLAQVNGVRSIYKNRPHHTHFCMSNPEGRRIVAEYIADYASKHENVDYLHVWLADGGKNLCECEACRKKTHSDWYVLLLNEIDRSLRNRDLSTRIVFLVYTETTWAPKEEVIENPDRFTLMIAPVSRSYTRTQDPTAVPVIEPYVLNVTRNPRDLDTYLAHFDEWRKSWKGAAFSFEYHFWIHQVFDLSGQVLAKRIFEDAEAYHAKGIDGMVACGSLRSFFPNGFAYYLFARKQFDLSLSYEEILEDYYSHAYGEDWRQFADYLSELGDTVGFGYLEGEESEDESISSRYSPTRAKRLQAMDGIVERGMELIRSHYNSPLRAQTVSVRLLEAHAEYARRLAPCIILKATGKDDEALKAVEDTVIPYLCEVELLFEKQMDFYLIADTLRRRMARNVTANF